MTTTVVVKADTEKLLNGRPNRIQTVGWDGECQTFIAVNHHRSLLLNVCRWLARLACRQVNRRRLAVLTTNTEAFLSIVEGVCRDVLVSALPQNLWVDSGSGSLPS